MAHLLIHSIQHGGSLRSGGVVLSHIFHCGWLLHVKMRIHPFLFVPQFNQRPSCIIRDLHILVPPPLDLPLGAELGAVSHRFVPLSMLPGQSSGWWTSKSQTPAGLCFASHKAGHGTPGHLLRLFLPCAGNKSPTLALKSTHYLPECQTYFDFAFN